MKEKDIPKGFTKKELRAVNGEIVMPETWFFNHQPGQLGAYSYFLTRESLKKRGYFKTGLTLLTAPGKSLAMLDSESVDKFFEAFTEQMQGVIETQGGEPETHEDEAFSHVTGTIVGTFNKAIHLNTFGDPASYDLVNIPKVTTEFKMSVNKKTGASYVAYFESPTEVWDTYMEIGQTMLDSLQYDPNK